MAGKVDLSAIWKAAKSITSPKYGHQDAKTSAIWSTPWSYRTEDGIYVGHTPNQVWLYTALPVSPLDWEEPESRVQIGNKIQRLLVDLESESRGTLASQTASQRLARANYREVHLTTITWEDAALAPKDTATEALRRYIEDATAGYEFPQRVFLLGVKLRAASAATKKQSFWDDLTNSFLQVMGEATPDLDMYQKDIDLVRNVITRYGGRIPTEEQMKHLEAWYNDGKDTDAIIIEEDSQLVINGNQVIEMIAITGMDVTSYTSPYTQWLADALAQNDGPTCISIRAKLEPSNLARSRARKAQRKVKETLEEEAKVNAMERIEYTTAASLAKEVEDFFASNNEPILTDASFVLGRKSSPVTETFMDMLRNYHNIDSQTLNVRQLEALDETLPCSNKRVNPHLQDVTIGMVAFSGMHSFDAVGDKKGSFIGFTSSDLSPVFLDPRVAAEENKSPTTVIVGRPGSGKTFTALLLAIQSALAGEQVIVINPKAADPMDGLNLVDGLEGQVETIHMSDIEKESGGFDPFRFAASPEAAAEMLGIHILDVLVQFSEEQQIQIEVGLQEGARNGARCAFEAISYIKDVKLRKLILDQAQASPLFSLAIGKTPRSRFTDTKGLTVIEFDRALDLPAPNIIARDYTKSHRISLAAMRLVTKASIEILLNSNGGTLIVDEAWTFLSHPAGRAAIQKMGREGRAQAILPILVTQRMEDILDEDMEGYISRAFIMELPDRRDAEQALGFLRINPTQAHYDFLSSAGPIRGDDETPFRPARGIHRDILGRKSAMYFGPVSREVQFAISSNPIDKKKRQEMLKERAAQQQKNE